MKNQAFTLIELLAVIVILGIIALIATPIILDVVEDTRYSAFKESVNTVFRSYEIYEAEYEFAEIGKINITDKEFPMNSKFKTGQIYRNENGEIVVENVSDGMYCASGTKGKLSMVKGPCDTLGEVEAKVEVLVNQVTTSGISLAVRVENETSGVKEIYYSLNGKDYKTGEISVFEDGTIYGDYTFEKLESGKEYEIKVKVINGNNIETIIEVVETTLIISMPTYAIDTSDWAQSKKVTINYPSGEGLVYDYSLDKGTTWLSATKTQEVTFTTNGSIIARVKDGTNVVTANTFTVDKIDTTVPVISEVSGNTDSWTKDKTLTVTATDEGGSGIKEYSFDNGSTWQTSNEKKITANETYNIKVKDNAGNVSVVSTVEVTKIDNNTPTITVAKSTVGSNYIVVTSTVTNNPMGISKMEYSIDNGSTWTADGTSTTHTFSGLTKNKSYTIKARITSNNGKVATSESITVSTADITVPTYAINNSGWSQSKKVTITYPSISGQTLTYEYSLDKGTTWLSATKTQEVTFNSNGSIIARVLDGTNTVTANTFTVDKIDTTAPVISGVSGNTDSWTTNKTLTVNATDEGGSEIAGYSFDNGSTWQTSNSKKITANGTYNIKVKDNAGNVSEATSVVVSKIDTQTPTIAVAKTSVGSSYIVVTSTVSNNPMGISKMEYSIDNGSTWIEDGVNTTHTFSGLTKNKSYTIKARITSNNGKTATSTAITVSTSDITVPTYAIDNSGWAQSKKVTITYPTITGQTLTYEYSIDKGTSWKTATKTQEITFTSNGSIIARVQDGTNVITANTFTVDKIDTTVPTISSVSGNTDSWTKDKTLTVNATDEGGSEIKEYSFDNGSTWQTGNSKKITSNGTYNIKVKDNAGNISAVSTVEVTKIDTQTPTITVAKTSVGSNYIVVKATIGSNPIGISKMEYSIDNGSTWTVDGTNTTHTFSGLTKNKSYTIKARITSKNGKTATSTAITVSTTDLTTPTYSIDNNDWAQSKKVTITYPSGDSLTYEYSLDKGTSWKTATKTQEVTFTANGTIIARVKDGTNTVTANTFTVDKIDTTVPTVNISTVKSGTGTKVNSGIISDETLKITLTKGTTGGSGSTLKYCVDTANTCTPNTTITSGSPVTLSNTGTFYIRYQAFGGTGKNSSIYSFTGKVALFKVELIDGLTPVKYNGSNWVVADGTKTDWYNYGKQEWANAVILNSGITKSVGSVVNINTEIKGMFVYIPRYEYKITGTYGKGGSSAEEPGEIEINFIPKGATATSGYRIHPSFTFGNQELAGLWVGKFETSHTTLSSSTTYNNLGCSNESCSNADGLRILPNKQSLRNNDVSRFFYAVKSMTRSGNAFGFDARKVDSHMMKNSEWGAIAYLSQSKYGKYGNSSYESYEKMVEYNSCALHLTGIGPSYEEVCEDDCDPEEDPDCVCEISSIEDMECVGTYETANGQTASTTGNITGVYDMKGGSSEYVMGVSANSSGVPYVGSSISKHSGFKGPLGSGETFTGGLTFPTDKYYDLYKSSSASTACNGGVCYGHALSETSGWYNSGASFIMSYAPWLIRNGVFDYGSRMGNNNDSNNVDISFRVVLVPYQDANAVAFSTDSWITIIDNVKVGKTDKYNVGDTKEIDLGSLGKHVVRIVNKSVDECSYTTCGFVIEFADIISLYNMNTTSTNSGGWKDSAMRTYVNNTIYNALPKELREAILDTTVKSENESADSQNYTTTDKLYLLSPREIWGSNTVNFDPSTVDTKQLEYYSQTKTTTSNYGSAIKYYNGAPSYWWLRSAYNGSTGNFYCVHGVGNWINDLAEYTHGVSPAFRIG